MAIKWHPEQFNNKLHKSLVGKLWKSGFMVETDAKKLCPVDTGRLRASITTRVDEDALAASVSALTDLFERPAIGVAGTDVYYALYVELGTYKMAARPYLRPALEKNRSRIKTLLSTGI